MLKNKEVQPVFRSLDMVEIDFEDIQCKKLKSSDSVVTASYILHLQCPFRIQNDKIVILESNDLYKPIGNAYQADWEIENCGNIFDAKLPKANAKLCGKKVSKVSIDRDVLHIELDNDLFIRLGCAKMRVMNHGDFSNWTVFPRI